MPKTKKNDPATPTPGLARPARRGRRGDPGLRVRATPDGWRVSAGSDPSGPIGVLFDMDGVLIDSYDAWFDLVNAARGAFGRPPIDLAAFDEGWGQGLDADAERYFPGLTAERLGAYFDAHFMDHVGRVRVMPGARETLAALRERSVPTAIVTNTPRAIASDVLSFKGLVEWIDELVGADEVENAKPAPDMVREACRRLGVEAERCLMVGDSRFDQAAARRAGVLFVGYGGLRGDVTLETLTELPERIPG